ncbi:DUF4407 domain-containing protein [Actinokineospora sp. 24-640]
MADDQVSGGVRAEPARADGVSSRFATLLEKYGAGPEAVRAARDQVVDRPPVFWRMESARTGSPREAPPRHSMATPRPRRWSLSALTGADPTLLRDLPGTRLRYTTLGASMVVSALVAAASVWLSLTQLGFGPIAGVLGGIAFGVLVLVLERVTVVSLVGHGATRISSLRKLLTLLPQVAFGVLTAIVISVPLVLSVFRPEINKQLLITRSEQTVQIQKQVEGERKARRLPLERELDLTTDAGAREDLALRLVEVDTDAARLRSAAIAEINDSSSGLLARLEALSELRSASSTLDAAAWTLVGTFALISFMPTLLASVQRFQPANAYDLLIRVREQYVPRERELDELREQVRVVSDVADREDVELPAIESLSARLETLTETMNREKEEVLGQVIDLDTRRNRKAS